MKEAMYCYIKGHEQNGLEESSHCEVLRSNKDPSLTMTFEVVIIKVKDMFIQSLL